MILKKTFLAAFIVIATTVATNFLSRKSTNSVNYVPNKETAIKIAEAILVPIYGEKVLDERPFTAELIDNKYWHVEGTLKPVEIGGTASIDIQKSDCKVLKVTHGK